MPAVVKKGMSVTILTTIFTALGLSVITWFGNTALDAHDTKIDVSYVKSQMDTLNQSMVGFVEYAHENRMYIEKHNVKIAHCEKRLEKCESND